MNSTRIGMKLMGFSISTGKDSNYSLIGKDKLEVIADKRTRPQSTDKPCQRVDCGYIL